VQPVPGARDPLEEAPAMTTVMIALLVGLSGYLGMRLQTASSENSALRANIALLKRRLAER
jgi:hypothetical protein